MPDQLSFSQAIERLEEIVKKLENQNLDLEEAVNLLTEGISLHKICQEKLKKAQHKIDQILVEEIQEQSEAES